MPKSYEAECYPDEVVIQKFNLYGMDCALRFITSIYEKGRISEKRANEMVDLLKERWPGELNIEGRFIQIRDNEGWI